MPLAAARTPTISRRTARLRPAQLGIKTRGQRKLTPLELARLSPPSSKRAHRAPALIHALMTEIWLGASGGLFSGICLPLKQPASCAAPMSLSIR